MDFQNLQPSDAVRNRNRNLAVKPSGPAQCRVKHIGQVGGGDYDDVLAAVKSVHQGQQLGDDALFDVAYGMLALGRDGVDLVQKDDTGASAGGVTENLAQMRFAFAVELMHHLGTADRKKVGLGFVCDSARDQGLAASGRSIEQYAFGWINPQALEHFGIAQREFDGLADAVELGPQPADVLIGDGARDLFLGELADNQIGRRHDQHRTLGRRALHPEVGRAAAKQGRTDAIAFNYRETVQQAADIFEIAFGGHDIERRDHDPVSGAAGDPAHRDQFVQSRPRVFPADAVELDAGVSALVLVGRHHLAHRVALAPDLDDIAHRNLQPLHVLGINTGKTAPDILAHPLNDLQFANCGFGLTHWLTTTLAVPAWLYRSVWAALIQRTADLDNAVVAAELHPRTRAAFG